MERFPLPDDWRWVKAEDIADPRSRSIVSGPFGSNIGSRFFVESGVPVIRGNNLRLGGSYFVDDGFVFLTDEKAGEFRNCEAIRGDLVFTAAGTIGQVGIIPKNSRYAKYIISNKQLRLRCDPDAADPNYLFYWFSAPQMRAHIENQNTGSSIPLINLGVLRSLPIALPPLDVQQQIVAVLSVYATLIENNIRRIQILEEMAQAIYREWFVNFRFPGHEQAEMAEAESGLIPQGWESVTLGQIAEINAISVRKGAEPDEIHYVDIASVSPGRIDAITKMAFSDAPGRARRVVRHGDTIWSTVRPNRKGYALVLRPQPNLIASTGFAVITPVGLPFSYIYSVLSTDSFADYLTNQATGSAYPAVNTDDFKKAEILKPAYGIVEQFHVAVAPLLELKDNLQCKGSLLRQTRDLLLPKLISGELSVQDLDIDTGELAA